MNTSAQDAESVIIDPPVFGPLLLDLGVAMLHSGASGMRIRLTMKRFAAAYDYEPEIHLAPRSITLTLHGPNDEVVFTGTRSTPFQGVNFKVLSGMSRLSWSVTDGRWSEQKIRAEIDRLLGLPPYSRWVVLLVVGLAGAGFCFTFGGDRNEMTIVFVATIFGLFVKQELVRKKFNTYIVTYLSSTIAGVTTSVMYLAGVGSQLEHAFATSVLFLIPGVPLINSFTDLIDGDILLGVERATNALLHALAIAFGLTTVVYLSNLYT
jgi:uncharacterized membrane protein YjjP (DUF1212 family)